MAFNNEIEKVKAQIKVLEKKLLFLEELEQIKSPMEEAYKNWWGEYPSDTWQCDVNRWDAFQAGYNAAYEEKVSETTQERGERLHKNVERCVRESVKWCEENPDKDPLDWVKPQTPEQVADGLKEAFREAVKQGVVSSTKRQTLYDLIADWWDEIFMNNNEAAVTIESLVDDIEKWLPKPQSAAGSQNVYVESAVEGFNDCLTQIKGKLR